MDVACAVKMLLLDPECTADAAILLPLVPERPVVGLEIVAAPGPPAPKFAFGTEMQVRTVEECAFGQVVHAVWPFFSAILLLNPIHRRSANRTHAAGARKALDSPG